MYDFGLLIKQLRKSKGLSQARLGEKINVSKTAVSKYESNTQSPTLETFIKLAQVFNVSLDYLAGIEVNSSVPLDGLSKEQAEILLSLSEAFKTGKSPNIKGLSKTQLELLNNIINEFLK